MCLFDVASGKNNGWWLILFAGILGLLAGFFVFPFLYGLSFDYNRFSLSPGVGEPGLFENSNAFGEGETPASHVTGISNVQIGWLMPSRTGDYNVIPIWDSNSRHKLAISANHNIETTIREVRAGTFGKSKNIEIPASFFSDVHIPLISRKWNFQRHNHLSSHAHRTDTSGRWDMDAHMYFESSMWGHDQHKIDMSLTWVDDGHDYFTSLLEPYNSI